MSLAFDVNDQGVEIFFAPSFADDDLPDNRVSLTGINQQNILRMRGVAGGGALTAGAQRVPHRNFVILSGQPQDRAEDGADILPHEKMKLELAQAFGSEIAQMGDVVQAIMAALDPASPLDVSQKVAVQDVVRDLIALKVLMNAGDIQASQIIVAAQGLLDTLVTTLKTSENAPILPPQLAQFIQGVVTQVAAQYNAPILMTAVERLAPLVVAFLPETPAVTFQLQSFVSGVPLSVATPVIRPSIAQGISESVQPAVSKVKSSAPAPIISTPSTAAPMAAQAIPTATAPSIRPAVIDAAIPIAVAAAFMGNPEPAIAKPVVAQESAHPDRPAVKDAPQAQPPIVKPDAPIHAVVPNAPQVKQAEVAVVAAQPATVAAPPPSQKASDMPQVEKPVMQQASVKLAEMAAVPISLAVVAAAPIAPVKIEMPAPAVIATAAPLYVSVAATGACGKANCDCSKDFRAVSGTPFEIKTALVMDLGEKTTASILAKYDGDVQKAAVFVATEQKAQAKALDAISAQMQIAETSMKSSQAKAMDALSRSILGVASGASATRSAFTKSCADGTCDHDHHKPGALLNDVSPKSEDETQKSEKVKRAKFERGAYKPKSL